MSKTNFTPGPWGIERTSDRNWIGPLRPNGTVDSIVVYNARGLEYWPGYVALQDANAHLIAAAPELYRVLESLEEEGVLSHSESCMEALAALAKARGEGGEG